MNKCAVIIGVNKTGGMPKLAAAVKGANDFKQWALSQGYDVELHTDEDGTPVEAKAIKQSIRKFIEQANCNLMLVFFAGHGILKSAMDEFWLLSGAPDDPNEA